jgi:hypothetical protein
MKTLWLASAAVAILLGAVPASARKVAGADVPQAPGFILVQNGNDRGGSDYGPMGQCFDARACGHRRGSYASASACSIHLERVVTQSGRVIFKRHRVCT